MVLLLLFENKITSVSNLVQKTDYYKKINEIEKKITDHNHYKYVTTPEFSKLTSENFAARLKQASLASKSDIANFVNKTDFDNQVKNVTSNKNELNELSKKVKAISTKWLIKDLIDKFSIINGAKKIFLGIFQNYLVFITATKHIKYFYHTTQIYSWKSNGMSEESIENIAEWDSNFAPIFVDHHSLPNINLNGHCLIKNNNSITKKVINLYMSYTLVPQLRNSNTDFKLSNYLFGSVKPTNNADLDKKKYTVYGIGFDSRSDFLFIDGGYGKYVIIFGADMNSSVHADNNGKDILIFGEGPTQRLDDTTLTTEEKYPTNFTQYGKRFLLCLHYNGSNIFLFVNAVKVYQFKAKNSEINDYALCLGMVQKILQLITWKKNRIKRSCKTFFCWF